MNTYYQQIPLIPMRVLRVIPATAMILAMSMARDVGMKPFHTAIILTTLSMGISIIPTRVIVIITVP
jgi:hypothetical protein